jgi:hypothetical protein
MRKGVSLILIIPLVFNLGELLNSNLSNNEPNLKFIAFYILPLLLSFLLFKPIKLIRKIAPVHIIKRLSILAIVSVVPFTFFLVSNIKTFDLVQYAQFMEGYRNSAFEGSGGFTFLATNIFPLTYCYSLLNYRIPKTLNIIFAIVAILPPIILGLRVWLIPLFIVSTILMLNKRKNIFQTFAFGLLILIIILSTKLILAPELYSSDFQTVTLKILSRTNYQAISTPPDLNLLSITGFLNFYEMKEYFYYRNQTHIESLYFNRIGNTGGIAMPLTIFLTNSIGYYISSLLLLLIFLTIFFFLRISAGSKIPVMIKNMGLNLAIILIAMIIEDVYFATKIFIIPVLMIVAQLTFVKKPFTL